MDFDFRRRPRSLITILFISLCLISLITCLNGEEFGIVGDDDTPSAYEILEDFDFPIGLLPKGVTGYTLDKQTGKFSASMKKTCSFSLEGSYQLRYKSTIRGVISKDKLTNLEGVSVKILLFWVNIIEVVRKGDELEFSVGIASANFGIENFEIQPQCGCGLDCGDSVSDDGDDQKEKIKPVRVSSRNFYVA
ncbi:hypothetical protein MKW94_023952 [Papaver nudicaule]|uniref:DUF538 domain-containing protein n=1 Tax=Papaver nudicaule TaxID=74823 RepID=A0AA41SMA5_PAPNU|nr:hypothetical protein [Papaver nudicaule]